MDNKTNLRKSRDLKEELLNQRITTSQMLENMNIKVPGVWRQKEEAFLRFKEMKSKTIHRDLATISKHIVK